MAADLIRLSDGSTDYDTNIYAQRLVSRARSPELLEFHKDSGFVYTVADLSRDRHDRYPQFCFTGEHETLLGLERFPVRTLSRSGQHRLLARRLPRSDGPNVNKQFGRKPSPPSASTSTTRSPSATA